MAVEAVTVPELAELVKPVRSLITKSQKISAIKLVRSRTHYGLKESKDFVDFVASQTGAKARSVAELWVGHTEDEQTNVSEKAHAEPAAAPTGEVVKTRGSTSTKLVSLADWYVQYMMTHTYAEWEALVEKCIGAK